MDTLNERKPAGASGNERERHSGTGLAEPNVGSLFRLLVIGYGNSLRGDDGIGSQIAYELAKLAGDSTRVLVVHQLTPELAEPISEADLVIFIDACHEGIPGNWTCETIRPEPNPPRAFTHNLTPATLLGFASALLDANPKALLISVAGGSFDCGEVLSPSVAAVVPEIVACICEWWNASTDNATK
jgi:hydrogenase maturation protease